jgi:hypothetical protein
MSAFAFMKIRPVCEDGIEKGREECAGGRRNKTEVL